MLKQSQALSCLSPSMIKLPFGIRPYIGPNFRKRNSCNSDRKQTSWSTLCFSATKSLRQCLTEAVVDNKKSSSQSTAVTNTHCSQIASIATMECHVYRMIGREYRRKCFEPFVEFKTGAMDSIVCSMRRFSEYYNCLLYIIIHDIEAFQTGLTTKRTAYTSLSTLGAVQFFYFSNSRRWAGSSLRSRCDSGGVYGGRRVGQYAAADVEKDCGAAAGVGCRRVVLPT
jgi:hypothetical protein